MFHRDMGISCAYNCNHEKEQRGSYFKVKLNSLLDTAHLKNTTLCMFSNQEK